VPTFLTKTAGQWLLSLTTRLQSSPTVPFSLALVGQGASIAASDLIAIPASGLYRVSYRARVTTAATSSSSLTVTITSTDGGVACAMSSGAYTGNAVNAPVSGWALVRTDAGVPITYATTYASAGATAMVYRLDLIVEAL
jgi:hypothetical protein